MSEIISPIPRVEQDTLELSRNVSYGVVPVGRLKNNGNSACQLYYSRKDKTDISTFKENTSKLANSDKIGIIRHKYQYTRWLLGCFSALVVANVIVVIALVVAFALIV